MSIKSTETIYNNYRFRSRLEARWAVFFDSLGIKYQYEPEDFALPDGTRYLPDFKLIDFDYFVEIKPKHPTREEMKKAALTPKRVYIFAGDVWPGEYSVHLPWAEPTARDGYYEENDLYLGECRYCAAIIFGDHSQLPDHYHRSKCPAKPYSEISENEELRLMGREGPQEDTSRLMDAYKLARQARFEHGEEVKTLELAKECAEYSATLYNGYKLAKRGNVAMFEREHDAIIAQNAVKDQGITCVATGDLSRCRNPMSIAMLALCDQVLICFGASKEGDEAARWWTYRLKKNAKRWRPFWGNVEDMAKDGVDIADWLSIGFEVRPS